jgi:CIC family chloride channel protein
MVVGALFLIRFVLGPISYAAGTPGGLFAPMLVLGAQSGLILGKVFDHWFPSLAEQPTAFAVVGMAAFFTAIVRAPVTGIVLVTEMTGDFTLLLPMLLACFAAMAMPTLMRNPPLHKGALIESANCGLRNSGRNTDLNGAIRAAWSK